MTGSRGRPAEVPCLPAFVWLTTAVCLLAAVIACSRGSSAPVGAAPESSAAAVSASPVADAPNAPPASPTAPTPAPTTPVPAAPDAAAVTPTAPDVPELPPYEVRIGREAYQHYCQTCHGESGAGDGFNAFNLDPHPRDLSDPDFQKKKSDDDLRDAIRRGGAGVGLSPLMPPWGHTLTDRQVDGLILYLRTFRRPPG